MISIIKTINKIVRIMNGAKGTYRVMVGSIEPYFGKTWSLAVSVLADASFSILAANFFFAKRLSMNGPRPATLERFT